MQGYIDEADEERTINGECECAPHAAHARCLWGWG